MDYKCTKKYKWFFFWFLDRTNRGFIQTPCSHCFQSLAEPTALKYLYRNLLITKNCMVDGRLHELFKQWINYKTVASFQNKKKRKETLAFICTKALCKRPCSGVVSWNVSSAGFLKKHLSTDLITKTTLGIRAVPSVCGCSGCARLGSECERGHQGL